jgi:hypothetical protein
LEDRAERIAGVGNANRPTLKRHRPAPVLDPSVARAAQEYWLRRATGSQKRHYSDKNGFFVRRNIFYCNAPIRFGILPTKEEPGCFNLRLRFPDSLPYYGRPCAAGGEAKKTPDVKDSPEEQGKT